MLLELDRAGRPAEVAEPLFEGRFVRVPDQPAVVSSNSLLFTENLHVYRTARGCPPNDVLDVPLTLLLVWCVHRTSTLSHRAVVRNVQQLIRLPALRQIVLLDPDVSAAFPNSEAVNKALRAILDAMPVRRSKRRR